MTASDDRKRARAATLQCIVFVDAVNSTQELKTHGHSVVAPKIANLRDFAEFCFVYRLGGEFIGELGDGFLILCPPDPPQVLKQSFACMDLIRANNQSKQPPEDLNVRIAIHFGLVEPPQGRNYLDSNISLTSRLEGATPPNSICASSVLHDIVASTLREYKFEEAGSDLKGFGESRYYFVSKLDSKTENATGADRLSFYLGTIDALAQNGSWPAVANTCRQALHDFKDNPEFWYQLALADSILGNDADSFKAYQECVRLNYKVGNSLYSIGLSYSRVGNLEKAISSFNAAVEKDPKHFHSMQELAEIHLKNGRFDEAWQWGRRAAKLAPRYFAPVALVTALSIARRKRISLEKSIRRLPEHNLVRFRTTAGTFLRELRKARDVKAVDQLLVTVFGGDWRQKCSLAERALRDRNKAIEQKVASANPFRMIRRLPALRARSTASRSSTR
jgi:tetratricopeptide (TPR) repeat protein